ncbi:MAG: single-stranded-DNA-specific exonuclease RecJ [Moraxellaceae bacterium]|nr:MAG: single-stranded-DNA-specific exonuclease RecJ [Moraxellaceae bacterium]
MKKVARRKIPAQHALPDTVHPAIQRIYAARGLLSGIETQLGLKQLMPAAGLKGLDDALALLVFAIENQQRILIVGDFDADGATSSALSMLALKAMGAAHVDYLVPNRFEYGYGLTPEIVEVALQRAPDLLMTVDNGISSVDGVAAAKAHGVKVLVTDHHLPGQILPAADAIVNPNQPGCNFASKNLAGVGVAFYVMTALRTRLAENGWFDKQGIKSPNMADFLDIVALGTVADVVPLDHNNRVLVYNGLRRMQAGRCRPGIKALAEVAKRNLSNVVASDMGFAIGPRLNAAGRLDDMSHGIECLLEDNPGIAREMAVELDQLNSERRLIEGGMQQEALYVLKQLHLDKASLPYGVCLYQKDWHQGVIGILASRIKERYNRPVIVFASAGGGELKGSARSVSGFHIRDALDAVAAKHPEIISKFGGHAMAAGLSIAMEHYDAFQDAFDQEVRNILTEEDLRGEILSDGALGSEELDLPFAQVLRDAGPWGQGFPEPLFDNELEILDQRIVGEKHLKLVFGIPGTNRVIDGIAFNIDLAAWPNKKANKAWVAYRLDINEFRGVQNPQLMVEEIRVIDAG